MLTTARCRLRAGGYPTRCTRWPTRYRSGWVGCAAGRGRCMTGCGSSWPVAGWSVVGGCTVRGCRAAVTCWRCSSRSTRRWRRGSRTARARWTGCACWRAGAGAPQDCELIDDHCAQLERWTLTGTELLAETPRVFLRQPCPRCGARFTYRRNDTGESVRVRCLRVSEAPGNRVFSLCADHGGNLDISERQQIARN